MMSVTWVDNFCNGVLQLDEAIRFVGLADTDARMIGSAYRNDETPLLTKQEAEIAVLESAIRVVSRVRLEGRLGRTIFELAEYERVKEVTIPIRKKSEITHFLMISLDMEADHDLIISDKLLPKLYELHL